MIFQYKAYKLQEVQSFLFYGELIDKNQALELLTEIENHLQKGENKFLLNFNKLDYINSSGLNVLINILTKARKSGGDIVICGINKKIEELLIMTKLDGIFKLVDNEEAGALLLTVGKN